MEHLTISQIIQFVSFTEMNENNLKLASQVNFHMIQCAECRKKVLSIQNTLDKLLSYTEKNKIDRTDLILDEDLQKEINDFYGS